MANPIRPVKADDDKPRPELIPAEAIAAAARAFAYGAKKYSAGNWAQGAMLPVSRLHGAVLRHLTAWWGGEDADPESGLSHLDHASSALAMLVATVARGGEDDRVEVGAAPKAESPA